MESNESLGFFAALGAFLFVFFVILVIIIIAQWKIFTKAGKPGWASIIPIYREIILFEIIGKPWWWLLLMLIPFVNIVFAVWALNLLSKSFGKNEGFTIGLLLLSIVFFPILAFGDSEYQGPVGNPELLQKFRDQKFQFDHQG